MPFGAWDSGSQPKTLQGSKGLAKRTVRSSVRPIPVSALLTHSSKRTAAPISRPGFRSSR